MGEGWESILGLVLGTGTIQLPVQEEVEQTQWTREQPQVIPNGLE